MFKKGNNYGVIFRKLKENLKRCNMSSFFHGYSPLRRGGSAYRLKCQVNVHKPTIFPCMMLISYETKVSVFVLC